MKEYFDNSAFIDQLRQHSEQTKLQLGLMEELTQLAQKLSEEACVLHLTTSSLAQAREVLAQIGNLMTLNDCAITSHEFKKSKLLWALNLFLSKTPSQAKIETEKKKYRETGEELKHTEQIDLMEAKKQSKSVSKKEGRCMILRLQQFTHLFLK